MADEPVKDEQQKPSTLSEAVAAAIKTADAEGQGGGEESRVEAPVEGKPAAAPKPEPTEEELEALQGRELVKALKDPQKAGKIIDFLATQNGYTKGKTEKQLDKAQESVLDDLKEALGEEFSFLADKLAPAIEKSLARKIEQSQADIRQQLLAQEQERLTSQSAGIFEKLGNAYFGPDKPIPDDISSEMSKLMDRRQPHPDESLKEYIEDIFYSVIGRRGLVKFDATKEKRITNNRNDAHSRLASDRTPVGEPVRESSQTMTREEAIRAALEAASKEG